MLKKLLTLSLVAVMLSTVAFAVNGTLDYGATPVYADEETTTLTLTDVNITAIADAAAAEQGIEKPVEYLWVTQTTTDDVVSQKITTVTFPVSAKTIGEGNWVLARYNVGENITFTQMKQTVRLQMIDSDASSTNPQTVTLYCAPLSYTDYNAARAIAGTTESLSTLVKPRSDDSNVKTYSLTKTAKNSAQNFTTSLDVSVFNNSGEYYHDGYVYLAFWANGQDGYYDEKLAVQSSDSGNHYTYHKLVFSGTQEIPVVDDFSDAEVTYDNSTGAYTITTATTTDEAYLIIASFEGTTMNDVELVTVNAATASRNEDGAISGTITPLDEGTIKIFLWDKATLAPATAVQ